MKGYSDIALMMGHRPEAELTALEQELQKIAEVNTNSGTEPQNFYSRDWSSMPEYCSEQDGNQWQKVLEIRTKLKEYYEFVILQAEISKLKNPDKLSLGVLREELNSTLPLIGADRFAWHDENEKDLFVFRRLEEGDCFSRWVVYTVVPFYHEKIGKYFRRPFDANTSPVCYYSDKHILFALDLLTIVIACLVPVLSVTVLSLVQSTLRRLAIIAGFTGVFALCLALTTKARRIEIFAATSAFVAVQVVFLGSTSSQVN